MASLRLIRLYLPGFKDGELDDLLEDREILAVLTDANYEDKMIVDVLAKAEQSEAILDEFAEKFGERDGFQAVVSAVEGVADHPDEGKSSDSEKDEREQKAGGLRVSREELYNTLTETLGIDRAFLAMVILSAIVAALGLVRDDLAVLIGAMVIAPLLGPNMAISLAVTLGDIPLLGRAAMTGAVGVAGALGASLALGMFLEVDPETPAIANRTAVQLSHFGLAMAAGAAGAMAFTRGMAGPVIGVMAAVALAPPLVAAGLLMGSGHTEQAGGAALLTLVNILSIQSAGSITFLLQGVRPRTWWEEKRAKATTKVALALTLLLLASLAAAVYIARGND